MAGSIGSLKTTTGRTLRATSVRPFGGAVRTTTGGRRAGTVPYSSRTPPLPSVKASASRSPTLAHTVTGSNPPSTMGSGAVASPPVVRFRIRTLTAVASVPGGRDT